MEMVVVAAVIVILALASLVVLVLLANKNPRLSGFRSISDPGFRLQTSSNIIVVLPHGITQNFGETPGQTSTLHPFRTPITPGSSVAQMKNAVLLSEIY